MSEARARTYARFAAGRYEIPELERAVRALYKHARARWLAHAQADEE